MMLLVLLVLPVVITEAATVAREAKEEKVAKEAAAVAFLSMKLSSFVKRITTGIRRTGTIKIMPLDMVVTPALGPTTAVTMATDTVVSTLDTDITRVSEVVRTGTATVPA